MSKIKATVKAFANENIDSLLRRFNVKVKSSNIIEEVKKKEYYIKPSARKRKELLERKNSSDKI